MESVRGSLQIPRRPLEDLFLVPGEEQTLRPMVGVLRITKGLSVVGQQHVVEAYAAVKLLGQFSAALDRDGTRKRQRLQRSRSRPELVRASTGRKKLVLVTVYQR